MNKKQLKLGKDHDSHKEVQLNQEGYVTLPFKGEDFKEFIKGLLGKPQTIDAEIDGNFEIRLEEIRNIYGLLNQRINQQNNSTLIQFHSRIIFSDGTSVLLNSYEELITYNEIKPIISEEVHLSFLYLITFNNKTVPEKQEISISFNSTNSEVKKSRKRYNNKLTSALIRILFENPLHEGYIQLSIKHTARTWRTDIEALLSNHINSILEPEHKLKKIIRTRILEIGTILILLMSSISIWSIEKIKSAQELQLKNTLDSLFLNNTNATLNKVSEQIKFVSDLLINRPFSKIELYGSIISILSIGAFFLIINSIKFSKNSYILLTKESHKFKKIQDKKYEQQYIWFTLSVFLSILLNLIASYLFFYLNR